MGRPDVEVEIMKMWGVGLEDTWRGWNYRLELRQRLWD